VVLEGLPGLAEGAKQRWKPTASRGSDSGIKNRWQHMKTPNSSVTRASLRWVGSVLLSMTVGAGAAIADTFEHGNSTATTQQSGGGTSRSEVTRSRTGQRIITHDGSSTDVTIQGQGADPVPGHDWGYFDWGDARFDHHGIEDRFPRRFDDSPGFRLSTDRDAFKQRMLERMRGRF